jgi:hypothetical protein
MYISKVLDSETENQITYLKRSNNNEQKQIEYINNIIDTALYPKCLVFARKLWHRNRI